ncbi:MAG TPA: GNAT family N-acetyltransferase [Gaiellaceae bacterium]|nr:GNAT family N-acetyltransferase [Gaiellaceae bacterium]
MPVDVRPVEERDRGWLREAVAGAWASDRMVTRGRLIEPVSACPGFVAELDGRPAGLVLFAEREDGLEVVGLLALERGAGVGSALLAALEGEAARRGTRAWLVTTNDNTRALRFYQRRGWELVALHREAVTEARRLKPEIPETGDDGIPIRHELELRWTGG